jgi:methylglutaconyl-CoA hydratase
MPVLNITRRKGPPDAGQVLRVAINRPDVRNAFDEEVIAALTAVARQASADSTLRALVLSGEGPAFCAGADLAWMIKAVAYSRQDNLRDAEDLARMLELMDGLPIPVIGRVHGATLGGGVGLVAICDIVVAADNSTFGFSEAKLGILPAVISPYVIAKIGPSAARELFLTGARFGAARARELGLVHKVATIEEVDVIVDDYLREISTSAPSSISAAKKLIKEISGLRPGEVIALTTSRIADQRVSADGQEGMRAFLEKRKPSWTKGANPDTPDGHND